MKTKIETVDDLRAERARLKNKLELSRIHMRKEINAIKTELSPARQAVGVVSDLLTTPRKGLLPIGVGIGVDLILRRTLLSKAGWLPRLIVPLIVRNVTTNLIKKNKTSIVEKALIWLKKATDKPQPKPQLIEAAAPQKLLPSPATLNGKVQHPSFTDN